ncbi:MAG: helix-turn-helix transcriptional regulator [Gammaproteobacteria bacterium]|nr:helix-turn-helix transcriptional regulator [Gammaproteobacteria bacterium]
MKIESDLNDYLTTREIAELLRLKERKVYDLAASGKIPCSRATGKLLFPRQAIESWVRDHASGGDSIANVTRAGVLLGSHDPLLEWAIRESRCGLASILDSSLDGVSRFRNGEGIACGMHVYDSEQAEWNRPMIESDFGGQPVVLVGWARRQRGIIVSRKNIDQITKLEDLSGRKMIPRQAEAGSQVLLNTLLRKESFNSGLINWTLPARSEVDAVVAVQEDKADATFGLATLAAQFQLGFTPVIEEQFDLLVDRRAWFEPAWQTLVNFCRTTQFNDRAAELVGYDISELFRVRFNA